MGGLTVVEVPAEFLVTEQEAPKLFLNGCSSGSEIQPLLC